jgi:hypothetical protein
MMDHDQVFQVQVHRKDAKDAEKSISLRSLRLSGGISVLHRTVTFTVASSE